MEIAKMISQGDIQHHFQPLYTLMDMDLHGIEGFIRSSSQHNPEELFGMARKQNLLYELDVNSIREAIKTYYENCKEKSYKPKLFLNIYPSTLLHPSFISYIYDVMTLYPIPSRRIVFEINENEYIEKMGELKRVIACLQSDFMFALDDIGSGLATVQSLIELELDFIKLDKFFSFNLAEIENKQKFVQFFLEYSNDNTKLILEGIERHKDLEVAQQLGVPIGQGYLLGRPDEISKVNNSTLYYKEI